MFLKPSEVYRYIALINELGYSATVIAPKNIFGLPVKNTLELLKPEYRLGDENVTVDILMDKDHVVMFCCLIASILEMDYKL